jgi:hypothetical protein
LIQQKERREDTRAERIGLRGSLTAKTSRRRSPDVSPASERKAAVDKASQDVDSPAAVSNTVLSDHSDAAQKPEKQPADYTPEQKRKNRKQRLPKFTRGAESHWFAGEESSEQAALDFLYPNDQTNISPNQTEPFEQIVEETHKSSLFSLSALLFNIETLLERIPLPLAFLALSIVIMLATANATTQWNHHEQRLAAIDKIATNAENDMLTYRLDDAINTLQELERTEKGDLPPRARAILNQSLWLRSYARAKNRQYSKALADLTAVSSTFISYDDVKEKSAEYKKLLSAHPEFADLSQTDEKLSNKASTKKRASANSNHESPAITAATLKRSRTSSKDEAILTQATERALRQVSAERDERVRKRETTPSENSSENPEASVEKRKQAKTVSDKTNSNKLDSEPLKKRKSGKNDAALLDADMKRYSGLLVEYFTKAETTRSGQLAEPPSYEEWTEGGKRDF